MNFRQLIVFIIISVCVVPVQAAFATGMPSTQIRTEIAAQHAAGGEVAAFVSIAAARVTVAVQNAATTKPAPSYVQTLRPLAMPTMWAVCSVS